MTYARGLPRWVIAGLAGSLLLIVAAVTALLLLGRGNYLPNYGRLPSFALTNQAGRTVTSGDLSGRVLAVSFIYTSCPDICPVTMAKMKGLQRQLAAAGMGAQQVTLLSISVDPVTDTPAELSTYAARYEADLAGWHFLTGQPDTVRSVVEEGFLMPMGGHAGHDAPAGAGSLIDHSGRVVLVDRHGVIRGYYDGTALDAGRVLADIRRLP